MNFTEWLTSSIGTTAVLAVVLFLFREWIIKKLSSSIQYDYDKKLARVKGDIDHEYASKLTALKSQLQSESGIVIARLESQLQITAAEKSIKLTEVFEKQAEIIAETYSMLVALTDAVGDYTMPITNQNTPPIEDRRNAVTEKWATLIDYYYPKKLYFPKPTQTQIDAFLLKIRHTTEQFTRDVENKLAKRPPSNPKVDTWTATMDFINWACFEKTDSKNESFS